MNQKLKRLKEFDLKSSKMTLWIVRRRLAGGQASYSVLRAETGPKLQRRMKAVLMNSVELCNSVKEYEYISIDQDEESLLLPASESDFAKILENISDGSENDSLSSENELVGAWGYVIEAEHNDDFLFGFRQSSASWSAKRTVGSTIIFNNQRLEEIDVSRSFKLDNELDFLCYKDHLFVHDKVNFEKGMNFRVSYELRRDAVVQEFKDRQIVQNPDEITRLCGTNLRILRKLATIARNAYYSDQQFIRNLRQQNESEGWGLRFDDEMIVVDEENLLLVLTLLNDDRLKSPISNGLFDVSYKVPVS